MSPKRSNNQKGAALSLKRQPKQRKMILKTNVVLSGVVFAAISVAVAGCGGSSGNSTPIAHVRVFDSATTPNSVTVDINGTSDYPLQTATTPPSDYLFINSGVASQFSYLVVLPNTTNSALPSTITPIVTTYTLNADTYYTAYTMGTPDLLVPSPQTTNPDALQVRVFPDLTKSGNPATANLQVLNSAYDAGSVDVSVNGTAAATALPFGSMSAATVPASGTVTVTVKKAGTSTLVLPAQTFTFAGGAAETLVLQETTSGPAVYTVRQIEN